MRILPMLIAILFFLSSSTVKANVLSSPLPEIIFNEKPTVNLHDGLKHMNVKDAEKILGRKLTLKEKIGFKLTQLKLSKALKTNLPESSAKGKTAFILSLIGLCLLIVPYGLVISIPLAIMALTIGTRARKENRGDKKAKTAIVLSILTLGLIVVGVLLIAVLLSSGGFGAF